MHHIFGIHPSSSFLNDAAVDVGLQAHVCQDMESLGYLPRSGTPGSYGSSSFNFWEASLLISEMVELT